MIAGSNAGSSGRLRPLRNLVSRVVAAEAKPHSGPVPVAVTVAAAKIPKPILADLCRWLEKSLNETASALGIRRWISVQPAGRGDDDATWVFVDGRPAAVVDFEDQNIRDSREPEQMARRIKAVLDSRYALFLDDAERAFHANAIREVAGDDRHDCYDEVPAYLLGSGVSLDTRTFTREKADESRIVAEPTAAAVAEVVINAVAEAELTLKLPRGVLQRADAEEFPRMRDEIFKEAGIQVPDVALDIVDEKSARICLKANDVWLDTGVEGLPQWPDVAAAVKSTIRGHADWFVRSKTVAEQRERLSVAVRSLIQLSRSTYSDAVIASCLRALVRSRLSVRNLQRVLWLLHDTIDGPDTNSISFRGLAGDIPVDPRADPESLASRVRARVLDEAWRAGVDPKLRPMSPKSASW